MEGRIIKREYKINLFVVIVILICLLIATFFVNSFVSQRIQQEIFKNLKNVANIVAYDTKINDALQGQYDTASIDSMAERIKNYSDGVEFIIVIDMQGNIYAHPNKSLIGTKYISEPGENPYSVKHHHFVSESRTGSTVKYFMPVLSDGKQIGVVITGTFVKDVKKIITNIDRVITISILIGLSVGTLIAIMLFGVEPREVTEILKERSAILYAIRDGIVAVNKEGRITTINDAAMKMFNFSGEEMYKPIDEVLPGTNLNSVLKTGEPEYDMEQLIGDRVLITNRIPVIVNKSIVGAVATFKDKNEATMLARELVGVKSMVDSLRAYTHEFMNKLHVILGLIQLGSYEEAEKYILQATKKQQQVLTNVMKNIKDPTTAGLLIGKFSRSREMGVELVLDEKSSVNNLSGNLSDDFIVGVLGNLIDNALEATEINEDAKEKKVVVYIGETDNEIKIKVADTGPGIPDNVRHKIFERGFSTKGNGRGIGLSIIYRNIKNAGGKIHIDSTVGKGSIFTVTIPKKARSKE